MIVGIDLGTTYSAVAHLTPDGARLIPNALGENLTPSAVAFDQQGRLLVGRAAKEQQVIDPQRCCSAFKRHMGTEWSVTLGRRKFTAEELSSLVLRTLKEDAEAWLKQPVERAVITVPAYFNDHQRKATIRAGELAQLKVERIINEPTAAAIAYGLHESDEEKIVVVFDLGGGTFDVSIVDMFDGAVEVRASSGECFLGGEDFTRCLAARVLELRGMTFERAELDSPEMVSRMIHECEQAKRTLSRSESAEIRIPDRRGECSDSGPRLTIRREQFLQWTEAILSRVELPVRRCLGDARVARDDVSEIILVGGATRMPAVTQRVAGMFGREPKCRLNPDEVVAMGAAVQAGLIDRQQSVEDLVVTDVAPFTLGIGISKRVGSEYRSGYFMPIINRNTTIPVSRCDTIATLHANQTELTIRVYQGEARRTEDNLLLGEFLVRGVPLGPPGQEIEVRFTYDLNGVLEVEATVVATRNKANLVITRHAHGLSEPQVAEAVQRMQALKTHPRSETANRYLLKRAERVYRELSLFEREQLGELIDGFEAVLDLQDKEAVERFRSELEIFLSRFDDSEDDP